MARFAPTLLFLVVGSLALAECAKVICYWNGQSSKREGIANVDPESLKPGLSYCTHLIYGFAEIDDDEYEAEPIDKKLDLDKGKGQYRAVTNLKKAFPGLSVLLSVGGFHDEEGDYFKVIEKPERRAKFINSVVKLMKDFSFDGVDLAWQFPVVNEKKERLTFGSVWHKFKKTLGVGVDDKAAEHRDQFTALVRETKAALRPDGKLVSIAALPHVNASVYFDAKNLMPHVDLVNLWTVDYRTSERSPNQADHAAPLFYVYDRIPHQNVDSTVRQWKELGADSSKLMLGIPTWGRSWKTTTTSAVSGVPPLEADGPGKKGVHTKIEGQLAYYEICTTLVSPTNPQAPAGMLRRIADNNKRLGTYGYRVPNKNAGESEGSWVSFEEPETATWKAAYAKQQGLGGVAIIDLGMDDAKGICDGTKFPITRAAKLNA